MPNEIYFTIVMHILIILDVIFIPIYLLPHAFAVIISMPFHSITNWSALFFLISGLSMIATPFMLNKRVRLYLSCLTIAMLGSIAIIFIPGRTDTVQANIIVSYSLWYFVLPVIIALAQILFLQFPIPV